MSVQIWVQPFGTLIVFLKESFGEKIILKKKKTADENKSMKKLRSMQIVRPCACQIHQTKVGYITLIPVVIRVIK